MVLSQKYVIERMFDIEEQGRMIFRGSFDGDETGFEARGSVIEAGKFPTDETDENFVHPAFGGRIGLRHELRQRCEAFIRTNDKG